AGTGVDRGDAHDGLGELPRCGLHPAVVAGLEHADHAGVLHAGDGRVGQFAELVGLESFGEEGLAVGGDRGEDRVGGDECSGHRGDLSGGGGWDRRVLMTITVHHLCVLDHWWFPVSGNPARSPEGVAGTPGAWTRRLISPTPGHCALFWAVFPVACAW